MTTQNIHTHNNTEEQDQKQVPQKAACNNHFTAEDLTDAMCIWEAILEAGRGSVYAQQRAEIGTAEMRSFVVNHLLKPVQTGWAAVSEEYPESFDWEFVPDFLTAAEDVFEASESWTLTDQQAVEIVKIALAKH